MADQQNKFNPRILIIISIVTALLSLVATYIVWFYFVYLDLADISRSSAIYGIIGSADMATYDFIRFVIRDKVSLYLPFVTYALIFLYSLLKKNYFILTIATISLMDLIFIFGKIYIGTEIFHNLHVITLFFLTPSLYLIALIYSRIKKQYLLSITLFLILAYSLTWLYVISRLN